MQRNRNLNDEMRAGNRFKNGGRLKKLVVFFKYKALNSFHY